MKQIIAVLFWILCSIPQTLQASVFEQPPDPRCLTGSSSTLDYYGKFPGRRHADDFILTTDACINQIDWWGLHTKPSSGLDDFVFSFYSNVGNLPGTLLLQTRGTVTSKQNTSVWKLTDYHAVLDNNFDALAGFQYWISIFNASPNVAWQWDNSVVGNETSVYSLVPPDNQWRHIGGTDIDLSFRLIEIPEPATLSLLALGAFLAGRKRKA